MKVKDEVLHKLTVYCKLNDQGCTAEDLALELGMRRNLVSQYLNELVKENKISKTNGRPVYFRISNAINQVLEKKEEDDIFSSFVGAYGSMKEQIEQCKNAVSYPQKGLPILLNGESGVGKSYLAELIYRYAKEIRVISNDAPFLTLNCADYASNPELLTSILFGYTKGAFTGAEKTTDGLVAQSDGGYLFLDEVHRLNAESQEKLFLLMDKNEYRRIGETKEIHHANVRLIFATTEDPNKVLLHTLRRRIPIVVKLPNLIERPITEKLELIKLFFSKESKIFAKDICIKAQALNFLLSLKKAEGNVGGLQSIIKFGCASGYRNSKEKKEANVNIDIYVFPKDALYANEINNYVLNDLIISNTIDEDKDYNKRLLQEVSIDNLMDIFEDCYNPIKKQFKNISAIQKALFKICDELFEIDNNENQQFVQKILQQFERKYGIHFPMNTFDIFNLVLNNIQSFEYENKKSEDRFEKCIAQMEKYEFKTFSLAEKLIMEIEETLGIKLPKSIVSFIVLYFILMNQNNKASRCNALIMAHGTSTASSIASVANELLNEFVFESFNMPADISFVNFMQLIEGYLERINKNYPTIILVDMGSLAQIYNNMEIDEYQEIGILDNVSTSIALEVGNSIIQGKKVETILKEVSENTKVSYQYIKPQIRAKAIVCACISGMGAAEKIKEIIKPFIREDCELITYDYLDIINKGKECRIFKEYDVQCLIGTSSIKIKGIDSININHLTNSKEDKDIRVFMNKVVDIKHQDLDLIQKSIIKEFSLENLLNRMVFLNPRVIIDDVDSIITTLEIALKIKFETDVRMMLVLHIAVLIERALMKNCDEDIYQTDQWIKENENSLKLIRRSFNEIIKKFNIDIPESEFITILLIIQSRKN